MQMVAFRAASSAPTPTPTPSPTRRSSVRLAWNANLPTGNPATNTIGYRLHIGLARGIYTQSTNLGNITTVTVPNLTSGVRYYCVVTAYNSAWLQSLPSNEVSFKAP